jgi:hypothetical protein
MYTLHVVIPGVSSRPGLRFLRLEHFLIEITQFQSESFWKKHGFSKIHAALWRTALSGSESIFKSKML